MDTRSRQIGDWMSEVGRGIVRLPRFQREEVWTPHHIERFLEAVLKKHPLGVFLVLEVDSSNQPFKTRPLADAQNNGERCREHLLDGQQRLVALWRSFRDNHESHSFYVLIENDQEDTMDVIRVKAVSRRGPDRNRIGNPVEEYQKNWIPIRILTPGDHGSRNATRWRQEIGSHEDEVDILVDQYRSTISGTIIPYLSLPLATPQDEAIDIFIETNTSSVGLSPYDLAVAQMEDEVSESLTEKVGDLVRDVPKIGDLESDVGDLVLKVQCLLEGKKPTYGNYRSINFQQLNSDWQKIVDGVRWTTEILDEIKIWNSQRLPTAVPLRVLPAIYQYVPRSGTEYANAMKIIKKYLWWSFLTDRYERQANDRLKEDFEELVDVIHNRTSNEADMTIYKCEKPTEEAILNAGWPTSRGILSRAILVAVSLEGANDIASNRPLRDGGKTEHHHVFPRAVLKRIAKDPDRSLNCMLLEPITNKEWAVKWPGDYLIEMVNESREHWSNPEEEVENRLRTHLLPAQKLIPIKEAPDADLSCHYDEFLDVRARMAKQRIESLLCEGAIE